jgi:hypothetical protein
MSWYESSGDELVLSAVLRQLPGLPAAVVEEHVTPHVPKMAERLFRRNRKEKVRNLFENNYLFLGTISQMVFCLKSWGLITLCV